MQYKCNAKQSSAMQCMYIYIIHYTVYQCIWYIWYYIARIHGKLNDRSRVNLLCIWRWIVLTAWLRLGRGVPDEDQQVLVATRCYSLLLVATRCYTMVFRPSWIKQNMQNRKIQAESQLQAVAAIATWRLKWKSICLPPCLRRFMGILMRFPRLKRSQLTRKNQNYGSTIIAHAIFPNLFATSKVQQWLLNPSSVISSHFFGGLYCYTTVY